MDIDEAILGGFEQAWATTGEDNDDEKQADPLALTEEDLDVTTDNYKLKDAHAFYRHLANIVNLYYHACLGESLVDMFSPMEGERKYEFEFSEYDEEKTN